jgi:hypothetical protein
VQPRVVRLELLVSELLTVFQGPPAFRHWMLGRICGSSEQARWASQYLKAPSRDSAMGADGSSRP